MKKDLKVEGAERKKVRVLELLEAESKSGAGQDADTAWVAVLTGESYTFRSACKIFGVSVSRTRKSFPRVTKLAIESVLRDVTAELELLNRLKEEFDRHVA